jgi:hypothetical protein
MHVYVFMHYYLIERSLYKGMHFKFNFNLTVDALRKHHKFFPNETLISLQFTFFYGFICWSCDPCWWVSSQLVLNLLHVFSHWYLCCCHSWLDRVCMCYLVAGGTTCLDSSCYTRSLRWRCVHLSTTSFLIHDALLVALVLSSTTSHLH